jgi:hypothetical protein
MQISYYQAQLITQQRERERVALEWRNRMLRAAQPNQASVRQGSLIDRLFRGRSTVSVAETRETRVATA